MSTSTLLDALQDAIRASLAELNTCLPAVVLSYDAGSQKATVQPTVKRFYRDGTSPSRPPITDVPVVFPAAGGGIISFPIAAGDTVMLMFSQRSLDKWLVSSGGEVNPEDRRMHSFSDAIAIPGLVPFQNSLHSDPESVIIKYKGNKIQLAPDGSVTIDAPSGHIINGDTIVNGNTVVNGALVVSNAVTAASVTAPGAIAGGSLSANGLDMNTHVHTGTNGTGTTGPAR